MLDLIQESGLIYKELTPAEVKQFLGDFRFQSKVRTKESIWSEYDGKYQWLLDQNPADIKQVRALEIEKGKRTTFSIGDRLYRGDVKIVDELFTKKISSILSNYRSQHVIELGCGYGWNIANLPNAFGGELTDAGVKLGQQLGLNVKKFDFYRQDDYKMIPPNSTVFTSHSLEQLPDAQDFIEGLRSVRNNVSWVINVEPTILDRRWGPVGNARNKYVRDNDYNRNLDSLITDADDIEIREIQYDVVGTNPLNPSNIYIWRFRG